MATVLVVDDSSLDRHLAGSLLEKHAASGASDEIAPLKVVYAADGQEALTVMRRETPDLVVTDMQMPEMDGLALVEAIRNQFSLVPVILMTARGSEDLAIDALHKGAAGYVPKKNLARNLGTTVENVLALSQAERGQQRVLKCLLQTESHYVLENDPALITPLVGLVKENLVRMKLCDDNGRIRVAVSLREALINAIHHGNLEIRPEGRDEDEVAYRQRIEERRRQVPYRDRRVHVFVKETRAEATYVIRDEGPGFAPAQLPDPKKANLEEMGRGLMLIRTFMDEVRLNEAGNEITLIKRRS
jgi:CheY-like chemotaxis protein